MQHFTVRSSTKEIEFVLLRQRPAKLSGRVGSRKRKPMLALAFMRSFAITQLQVVCT